MAPSESTYRELEKQLNDPSVSLDARYRALFSLKNVKTKESVEIIGKGLLSCDSKLLAHEMAYCLGQLDNPAALPILQSVLENEDENVMVRHEAAESLGAISSEQALPVLRKFLESPYDEIRETCEIAIAKIEYDNSDEGKQQRARIVEESRNFPTIDPAPTLLAGSSLRSAAESRPLSDTTAVDDLQATLMDASLPLFERYRAMFALRNIGNKAAVDALATGFTDPSALFRHEVAYVFGQLSSSDSVPCLIGVLENTGENEMVRHEAAEALGGIATDECLPILQKFSHDASQVVAESCVVALDMLKYEQSQEFSYATV